jgi:CheY-like chemotaxis protein
MGLFAINERLSYIGCGLQIDSAPGRGSRFKIIVPQWAIAAEEPRMPSQKQKVSVAISPQLQSTPEDAAKRIRIVLVDDHMVMRQGLASLLRGEPDFEIIGEASDGVSAVSLTHDFQPDVVLMDINMPGMDGIEATRLIHKEFPEIRVIGLSMFADNEQAARMQQAGAVNYLAKSEPAEAIIEAVRDVRLVRRVLGSGGEQIQ